MSEELESTFAPVYNWILCRKELTNLAKLLYGRLKQFAGKENKAWPSVTTLAEALGKSVRQVQNTIKELERHKLIQVDRPTDGIGTSYYYFLDHPWMKQHASGTSAPQTPPKSSNSPGNKNGSKEGVKCTAPPGEAHCTTPVKCASPPWCSPLHHLVQSAAPKKNIEKNSEEKREENNEEITLQALASLAPGQPPQFLTSVTTPRLRLVHSSRQDNAAPDFDLGLVPNMSPITDEAIAAHLLRTRDLKPVSVQATPDTERLQAGQETIDEAKEKANRAKERRHSRQEAKPSEWGRSNLTTAQKLKHITDGKALPVSLKKQAHELEEMWIREFKEKFPGEAIGACWGGKEMACASWLIVNYGGTEPIAKTIRYYIRYWEHHKPRFFRGSAILPNFGQVRAAHEQLVPEANRMFTALQAKAAYDKWAADNPSGFYPPDNIKDAYEKAKDDLKSIGL